MHHVTLQTAEVRQSFRSDVPAADVTACGDWIVRAIHAAAPLPLPAPHADHAGSAVRVQGGLGVTIYGPQPDIGQRAELLAFMVAVEPADALQVWQVFKRHTNGAAEGVMRPPAPWCAVSLLEHGLRRYHAPVWLARFVDACAWALVSREPVLRPVG